MAYPPLPYKFVIAQLISAVIVTATRIARIDLTRPRSATAEESKAGLEWTCVSHDESKAVHREAVGCIAWLGLCISLLKESGIEVQFELFAN